MIQSRQLPLNSPSFEVLELKKSWINHPKLWWTLKHQVTKAGALKRFPLESRNIKSFHHTAAHPSSSPLLHLRSFPSSPSLRPTLMTLAAYRRNEAEADIGCHLHWLKARLSDQKRPCSPRLDPCARIHAI